MVQISKRPSKRVPPLPAKLEERVKKLKECEDEEIKNWTDFEWNYPKGNLFQFVDVLNRFERFMMDTNRELNIKSGIQTAEFSKETKETLLAIIRFETTVFENCINRNIFNDDEFQNLLFNTTDIDILEAVSVLVMKVVVRSKYVYMAKNINVAMMVESWPMTDLLSDSVPDNTITMSFYETENVSAEGAHTIQETITPGEYTDHELFWKLVDKYSLSSVYHTELLNKIRIANAGNNKALKKQLLVIRLNAISIMSCVMNESQERFNSLTSEPNLIPTIVQLITDESHTPMDIQVYALYALENLAKHKSAEVLGALNLSATHGIMLHILRKLYQKSEDFTVEYVEAYFHIMCEFLTPLINAGNMILSAGLVSQLLPFIEHSENKGTIFTLILSKVIPLLTVSAFYSRPASTTIYSMDTLKKFLKALQVQTDVCIEDYTKTQVVNRTSLRVIKLSLKYIKSVFDNGYVDGVMNTVESDFPQTMKKLLDNNKAFSPNIFALTINLITIFINIEPTSLSVLQELQLPQIILKNFNTFDQPTFKILKNGILNFDAICLNSEGKKIFKELDPMPQFFKLLTTPEYVKTTTENSDIGYLGTCLEEFLRHHPQLESHVFQLLDNEIIRVIEIGNTESSKPEDDRHKLHLPSETDAYNRHKSSCLILDYINLVAELLRGLFRSNKYVKKFIELGGVEKLLQYYDLQYLPYNYLQSTAFKNLSTALRILYEETPLPFTTLVIEKVYKYSRFIHTELEYDTTVVIRHVNFTGKDEEGNKLLHKLSVLHGYCSLLPITFVPSFSRFQRFMPDILDLAIKPNEKYGNAIMLFGEIHRIMLYQHLLLRNNVHETEDTKFFGSYLDLGYGISTGYEYYRINIRRFHKLMTETTSFFMPVIQNIVMNALTHRSVLPPSLPKCITAKKVGNELAIMIKKSLRYIELNEPELKWNHTTFGYYAAMCSMLALLIQDDRDSTQLITPLIISLEDNSVTDYLIQEMFLKTWLQVIKLKYSSFFDRTLVKKIHTFLEIQFSLFYYLGNGQAIHESPHSLLVTTCNEESGKRHGYPVNFYCYITNLRCKLCIMSNIFLLTDPLLSLSQHGIHLFIKCFKQNLEAKYEISDEAKYVARTEKIPYFLTNRRALMSMGYERSVIETALREVRYGICALHWLFKRDLEMMECDTYPLRFDVSPDLESSSPLTAEELSDGVELLVKLGYNATLSKETLQKYENLFVTVCALDDMKSGTKDTIEETKPTADENDKKDNGKKDNDKGTDKEDTDNGDSSSSISSVDEKFYKIDGSKYEDEKDPNIGNKDPLYYKYKKEQMLCDEEDSRRILATYDTLEKHRKYIRETAPETLARMVDGRDDIDFDVRDLIIALCKGDSSEDFTTRLTEVIKLFGKVDHGDTMDAREALSLAINKIRIFALMLREPSMKDVSSLLLAVISNMTDWFRFLDIVIEQPTFSDPKWITTLFFVLESALARSDEPKENSTADKEIGFSFVTPENRAILLKYCVELLALKELPQDNVVATLRIIVRLTKHHEAALKFVELGGLEQLLWRPKTRFNILKIQQVYVIMILRHIIESKAKISGYIQKQLLSWARNSPEARYNHNLLYMSISNEELVLRDPDAFVDATSAVCRLVPNKDWDVRFIDTQEDVQTEEGGTSSQTSDNDQVSFSQDVMQYLLCELDKVLSYSEDEEQPTIDFAFTAFLIQCMFELVCSDSDCRYDIHNYRSHAEYDEYDIKGSFIYKIVDRLMEYNECDISEDKDKIKKGIARWTTALIVVMCFAPSTADTDSLNIVRETILDVIYQKYNDQLMSDAPPSSRYAQYFVLSEALYSILIARAVIDLPITNQHITYDSVLDMAKLMLKKKFVPLLMSVVDTVNSKYPFAKLILNSVMRPLEQLTRFANIVEGTIVQDNENDASHQTIIPLAKIEHGLSDEIDEEVNTLYRSSSLFERQGRYGGNNNDPETVNFDIITTSDPVAGGDEADNASSHSAEHHDHTEEDGASEAEPSASDVSVGSLTYNHWYMSDAETVYSNVSQASQFNENIETAYRFDDQVDGGQYIPQKGGSRIYRQFLRAEITSDLDDNFMNIDPDSDFNFLVMEHKDLPTGLIETPQLLSKDKKQKNNDNRPNDILLHPLLKSTSTSPKSSKTRSLLFDVYKEHLKVYEHVLGIKVTRLLEDMLHKKQQSNSTYREAWIDFNEEPDEFDKFLRSYKETRETILQIKRFEPLSTVDRWTQEVDMVFAAKAASKNAEKVLGLIVTRLKEIREVEGEEIDDQVTEYTGIVSTPSNADALERTPRSPGFYDDSQDNHQDENMDENMDDNQSEDNRSQRSNDSFVPRRRHMPDYNFDVAPEVVFYESMEEDSDDDNNDTEVNDPEEDNNATHDPEEDDNVAKENDEENRVEEENNSPNSGIDDEFLAALPEEVRTDLLNNNTVSEQEPKVANEATDAAVNVAADTFSPEFLDALPPEIRQELLKHEAERLRRKSGAKTPESVQKELSVLEKKTNQLGLLLRFLLASKQSAAKALVSKILLNLCKEDYTFNTLLSWLLFVLKSELHADYGFMREGFGFDRPLTTASATEKYEVIIRHCLETIAYLIELDSRAIDYLMAFNKKFEYKYPMVTFFTLLDDAQFTRNPALMNELMILLNVTCRHIPDLVKKEISEETYYESSNLPVIPHKFVQKLVDLISARECRGSMFKNSVTVLVQLSFLDGMLEFVTNALTEAASRLNKEIMADLDDMIKAVRKLKAGKELDRSILVQFSISNSNQAGLLRVLETTEFLFTCSLNPAMQRLNKNRKSMVYIYHYMGLDHLWWKLSDTMSLIEERNELSQVASVFLPLIESLMIVSKFHVTNKGKTEGEASSNEGETFMRFVEEHKDTINSFIRKNPSLLGGSFSVLLRIPRLIDFENKRKFFYSKLHEHKMGRHENYVLGMLIRRDHVFEDSFNELRIADNEIKDVEFAIEFENEEGQDAGGLTREWLTILSREIFDPNNALFVEADKLTYQPNRASSVNSEHLRYFKFVGLVIAKAIYDKMPLDVHFTRSFYKHMLKKPVDYRDLEAIDPTYFKSLVWLLENDITNVMELTFSVDTVDFGEEKEVDLKENGRNIVVTEENKQEYVSLVANQKLYLDIKDQIEYFLQGFYCIIPANLIGIFNEQELELLISGLPDIEVDDWIANTVYEGYTASSPQIKWFWRAVRSFSNEERVMLLQFSTGTSKVPLDGFAELQGSNGVQKFQIHKDFGDIKRLPSAHTCFNQIDLPEYASYKDLRAHLFKAISECTTGFAFA